MSTNGTTWTTIGTIHQRYSITNGWRTDTVNLTPYIGQSIYIGFLAHSQVGNNIYLDNVNIFDRALPPACTTPITPINGAINEFLNPVFSWNTAPNATSYDAYFDTIANPAFFGNITSTTYTPQSLLLANKTYYWKIAPKNTYGLATGCSIWSFTTGNSINYCSSTATNTADDDIGNVTFAGINNGVATPITGNTTSINLYTDYTAIAPAQVVAGGTYPISISQINSGTTVYGCLVNVYFDINHNGFFDATEKLFTATTSSNTTIVTGNVTIPVNSYFGTTRMRVVLDEFDVAPACGTYSYGETEDYLLTIAAPPAPSAYFTSNNLAPIINQTVALTDTSHNYPSAWQWTVTPATMVYVSGTNATTQNPKMQFTAAGLYTIKLKVINASGADSLTKTDYVNVTMPSAAPVADFSASTVNTNTYISDTLTDLSTNIATSWAWTITPSSFVYVNGTFATSQNPQIQFTSAGIYTVQLIATNVAGIDTALKTNYITVTLNYCSSTATNTADDDIGNVTFAGINNGIGTPALLNTTSVNLYTNFSNITGNVVLGASYPISITQINSSSTFYNCYAKVFIDYNNDGILDTASETAFQAQTASTMGGNTVTGNITIPTNAYVGNVKMRIVLRESGSNTTTLPCGTYSYGETEDYTLSIAAPITPIANFTANNTTPIIDQIVTFTDQSANYPSSWAWTITPSTFIFANATTATSQNPHIKFSAVSDYEVKLKVTNLSGSDSITKLLYIHVTMPANAPVAGFTASALAVTTGQSVTLTDTSLNTPTAWHWAIMPNTFTYVTGSDSTVQNPNVQFTNQGVYTIQMIASNAAGSDTALSTNYISVLPTYCNTNLGGGGACPGDITNVTISPSSLNNSIHTCSTANTNTYASYAPSGSNTGNIAIGITNTINVTTSNSDIISLWIDYDHSGTFDATEWTQVATTSTANIAATANFTIPNTALTGITGMRVRSRGYGNTNGATDACSNFGSGITEDYLINIILPSIPDAEFTVNDTTPVVDQIVYFTDLSVNYPSNWYWTITPSTFTYINSTTSSTQNPQVKFTAEGYYSVQLNAGNIAGIDSILKTSYIHVTLPTNHPTAYFYADNLVPFTNQTVSLIDTSINSPTSFNWIITPSTFTYVNATNATTENPQVQFTASGLYTIKLVATNSLGSDSLTKIDYINVAPAFNITNDTVITCNAMFYDSEGPSLAYLNNEDYTFTVHPTTATNRVSVHFTGFNTELNYDSLSVYNGNSVNAPFIGTYMGTVIPSDITSTANDGSLTFHFKSDVSTTGSGWAAELTCVPQPPPTANFHADDTTAVVQQTIHLIDESLYGPTSWVWEINPTTFSYVSGSTANTQNPQVQFTAAGDYTLQLKVANVMGIDSLIKINYIHVVTPTLAPIADFAANDTTVTTYQIVSLADSSTNLPSSWSWSIMPTTYTYVNGTSSTAQNPKVHFSAAGLYTVQLIAANIIGSDTATKIEYINVANEIHMGDSVISTCNSIFYDYGGSTGSYLNNMNDTLVVYPSTPGAKLSITFTSFNLESATYDYLKIFNGNSTSAPLLGTYGGTTIPPTDTSSATDGSLTFVFRSDGSGTYAGWAAQFSCIMPPPPVAGFYANDTTPIVEQVVTITDTSLNNPNSWFWSITPTTFTYVSGSIASSQNPQVTFQNAGSYTVTLIATNASTSDTLVKTGYINVTVPTTPPTAYFWANDTTPTTAQIVTITDTSANTPTAWQWDITPATFAFMNGTSATSQNAQVQFSAEGLYTITLTASNAAGPSTLIKTNYINAVSAFNMTTDTITTCSSVLFDSGSLNGNYSNNEHAILVIQPATPGNVVQLSFSSFNVQPGWDNLYVYNGTDTTGTLLAILTGTSIPATLFSTVGNGALTLKFKSDGSTTASGWDAYIGCVVPPAKSLAWSDTIFNEAVANDGTISTTSTITLTNEYFATIGVLTEGVNYTSANVPSGLTAHVVTTSNTSATINLTGSAATHTTADNISNLSIVFNNAAFSGNNANEVSNYSKNNLAIHFHDPNVIPSIMFSEIMYDSPDAGADSLEYFELFNYGINNVDLSNYTFSGVTYTIPNGTMINAGAYLVFAKNAAAILHNYGVTALQWNVSTLNGLSNTGELLKLITFWGATVDSIQYSNAAPWPIANGNGNSIVLCDPSSNHALAANWLATTSTTTHIINGKQLNGSPGVNDQACLVSASIITPNPVLIVYPNPAKETVNIEISEKSANIKIELFSIDGKKVLSQEYRNQAKYSGSINVSNLSPGIYMLRINTGTNIYFKKLTIQ